MPCFTTGWRLRTSGDWQTCRISLPLVLRFYPDHRSVFWLFGRRARDHGTGTPFLQSFIVPALLVDPGVSDPDRVHVLRLLYEVEYSGPRPLTDLAGLDLDGKPVSREDFAGKVLLVDFWATWCVPCLMEMPNVVAAEQRYRDEGFAVLGISLDRENAEVRMREVMAEQGMNWRQLYDGGFWKTKWAVDNDILAIPAAFLIDRSGRVRYTNLTGEELHRRIEELLDEG